LQNAIFKIKKKSKDLSFLFKRKHMITVNEPKKDSELENILRILTIYPYFSSDNSIIK
jgi:hypothetical protein